MVKDSEPPRNSRAERIAHNEAWCRDLNERKADWLRSGLAVAGFRCECWRMDCAERIHLSWGEWQEVRSESTRFAVAPDHVAADVEAVVEKYPHFWLVEKQGAAGEVAEKLFGLRGAVFRG